MTRIPKKNAVKRLINIEKISKFKKREYMRAHGRFIIKGEGVLTDGDDE